MVRVSNGFVVEQLTITENGTKLERLGDWDIRNVTESKALNALVRNCK